MQILLPVSLHIEGATLSNIVLININTKLILTSPVIYDPFIESRPEAAGEEAAVLHVVSEQLQGELGVLDMAV